MFLILYLKGKLFSLFFFFFFFKFYLRLYGHGLRLVDKTLKWLAEPAGLDRFGCKKKNPFIKQSGFEF